MLKEADIKQKLLDFEARFGRGGAIDLYFAPGRVNIIGEHTDYNGGMVLPIAIEQGTYLLIRRSEIPPCRLYSERLDEEARFHPSDVKAEGDWADYVRGVLLFAKEICDEIPPFDGLFFGDLPLQSGLSSSASLEVVTAIGLQSLGCNIGPAAEVKVSRRAENEFVGVACGVMDQFTVAFAKKGHALLLDCGSLDFRQVPSNIKNGALLVGHTGVERALGDSPYNERKRECEQALEMINEELGTGYRNLSQVKVKDLERIRYSLPEHLVKRTEHVIYENIRVEEAARCLERGDSKTLGHLMNRSHESLRDLYEVSCHELDALQQISVEQPGVLGCRMTGAGFGGCVIALVQNNAVERYLQRVPGLYWQSTHYETDLIVTQPEEGARKLEV